MSELIRIDGSRGEGGGQVLRSSLSLSLATGQPFRIEGIRGERKKPGLLRQHLTAVRAAIRIGDARADGAELGSTTLEFHPRTLRAGDYSFSVGTAGSTMLVLQTILVPLGLASGKSSVRLTGGTHNPWSPPFEALRDGFLPQLARMGIDVDARLHRHGFFPAGGGEVEVHVAPSGSTSALELTERGDAQSPSVRVLSSQLRASVAKTEIGFLRYSLGWEDDRFEAVTVKDSPGPGNVVTASLPFENVTEVVTAFGQKRLSARAVAKAVADGVRAYTASTAPVGEHLADQLLVPMALLDGGHFRATKVSMHTRTNAGVLDAFGCGPIEISEESGSGATIAVNGDSRPR